MTATAIPPDFEIVEVRVSEPGRLFNAIDPSPFHDRDLDPEAEQFIVDWAAEVPRSRPLSLVVYADRPGGETDDSPALARAINQYFGRRAQAVRRDLRELFRRGRISLLIGLAFLAASSLLANALTEPSDSGGIGGILRDGAVIGGWVAMWRPLEVFLYDWWPILARARRYDRLAAMPVRIELGGA